MINYQTSLLLKFGGPFVGAMLGAKHAALCARARPLSTVLTKLQKLIKPTILEQRERAPSNRPDFWGSLSHLANRVFKV